MYQFYKAKTKEATQTRTDVNTILRLCSCLWNRRRQERENQNQYRGDEASLNMRLRSHKDVKDAMIATEALQSGNPAIPEPEVKMNITLDDYLNDGAIRLSMFKLISLTSTTLVHLSFDYFSVPSLAHLLLQLPKNNNLRELNLKRVTFLLDEPNIYSLLGGMDAFSALSAGLRRLSRLQSFTMSFCTLTHANSDENGRSSRYDLAKALAGLPGLEKIDFDLRFTFQDELEGTPSDNSEMATIFCESKSLKSLTLWGFDAPCRSSICPFFESVKASPNIQHLSLKNNNPFSTGQLEVVAKMMENNRTLQTIELNVANNASMDPLVKALCSNSSLSELKCRVDDIQTESFRPILMPSVTLDTLEALLEALEYRNYYLKRFQIISFQDGLIWNPSHMHLIETYMRLNHAGRKRLLAGNDVTPTEWIKAIDNVGYDINAIFYLLTKNPGLCQI